MRKVGRVILGISLPALMWASVLYIFAASPPQASTSSPEQTVLVTGLPTKSRGLALSLDSTALVIQAVAQYDRNDPRAKAVIRDQVNTGTWFYGTFGRVSVDDIPIEFSIADAEIHWSVTGDSVNVRASKSLTQNLISLLDIGLNKDFPNLPSDQVTLQINEHTLRSMDPEPMTYSNGVARWFGSQASLEIHVGLHYTGPGKILDFSSVSRIWDRYGTAS